MAETHTGQGSVKFAADVSRGFTEWLVSEKVSLAVTTYQAGKVLLFGVGTSGKLWMHSRNIGRCLGLAADVDGFWVTSDAQLHRFDRLSIMAGGEASGCDAMYAPRFSYVTGDLDIHDIGCRADGEPVFVNTLFNCLSKPSLHHSFVPLWRPPFISALAPEDRCHLNGLAMRDNEPAYVTAVSSSDTYDGWREHRSSGGIVMDVSTGKIVAKGMSMPHSPRWHQGRLWVLNSGEGEFGWIDIATGRFVPVAFCPGYLRGLSFVGSYAVIGLSLPRDNMTFSGLGLDQKLSDRSMPPRCGLYVVDLETGSIAHSVVLRGVVSELFDVAVLAGVRQPAMVGFSGPEIKRTISIG